MLGTGDQYEGQKISAKDKRSVLGTGDQYEGQKISAKDPDAYMGFLHEVYAI